MNKKFVIYVLSAAVLLVALYIFTKPKSQVTNNSTNQENTQTESQPVVTEPKPKTFEIVIKANKLSSGPETIQVTEGDDVQIIVTSDVVDELHLHGYDKTLNLLKNQPVTLSFKATLTGRYVYELHDTETAIGALEVLPK